MNRQITKEEVVAFFPKSDLSSAGIFVEGPRFIDGREDFCTVKKQTGLLRNNVQDHFYFVWKNADGKLQNEQFAFSSSTNPDYIGIKSIVANGDEIAITYGSTGALSGKGPWEETYAKNIGVEAPVKQ